MHSCDLKLTECLGRVPGREFEVCEPPFGPSPHGVVVGELLSTEKSVSCFWVSALMVKGATGQVKTYSPGGLVSEPLQRGAVESLRLPVVGRVIGYVTQDPSGSRSPFIVIKFSVV